MQNYPLQLPPPIRSIHRLPKLQIDDFRLDNGLQVYALTGCSQPVTKVELVFLAGRPYETQKLIASSCAALMREGTLQDASVQLAQKIDFYGASLVSSATFDTIRIQLYCLSRHLVHVLPYLADIAQLANFPDKEISIFRERAKQRLTVDLAQNEIIAYRTATEGYFGTDHPYGYNSNATLYDAISREKLVDHYVRLIGAHQATCFIAGDPPANFKSLLQRTLGNWSCLSEVMPTAWPSPSSKASRVLEIKGVGSQSAIRIGRRLFNRVHPDFAGMFVLNTALGGYFGSRLMRNLREDKGLTYGVESSLETMRFDGYFSISLETEAQYADLAIEEIHREIQVLQKSPIEKEELQMIKNYLAGYLLSLMDGPLHIVEILRGNIVRNNPVNFTQDLLNNIQSIGPEELQSLAQNYLSIDGLDHVIVR